MSVAKLGQRAALTANQATTVSARGNAFAIQSGATGTLNVRFLDENRQEVGAGENVIPGVTLSVVKVFTFIEFTSTANENIVYHVATGDVSFNVFTGIVEVTPPNGWSGDALTLTGSPTVDTVTAPAGAVSALVTAGTGNAGTVWVGGVSGSGAPLLPGQPASLPGSGDLDFIGTAGDTVSILWAVLS